jgi:hypothetical protein
VGNYEGMSLAALLAQFVRLIRNLLTDEKLFLDLSLKDAARKGGIGAALGGASLIFLAISGIFLLVTITLLLNVWFTPWVSALIMTIVLMLLGLALALAGVWSARKGIRKAQSGIKQAKEDMAWLKKS